MRGWGGEKGNGREEWKRKQGREGLLVVGSEFVLGCVGCSGEESEYVGLCSVLDATRKGL